MRSEAKTAAEYLAELPEDRRKAIGAVREVIRRNLPKGYVEGVALGMIVYCVPLKTYPDTYNGQPLMLAALAMQKNYNTVHLMAIYGDDGARKRFEAGFKASGKRFDVGKACVRFKTAEDLPLGVIGETIASLSVEEYVRRVKVIHGTRKRK